MLGSGCLQSHPSGREQPCLDVSVGSDCAEGFCLDTLLWVGFCTWPCGADSGPVCFQPHAGPGSGSMLRKTALNDSMVERTEVHASCGSHTGPVEALDAAFRHFCYPAQNKSNNLQESQSVKMSGRPCFSECVCLRSSLWKYSLVMLPLVSPSPALPTADRQPCSRR